ncbi:MAG: hypothetical protein ABIV63_21405, partial [Caldimonas sp.]
MFNREWPFPRLQFRCDQAEAALRDQFPAWSAAAGVAVGVAAFGGWVPSDLWRFLPLAVFLTCFAEMVLLPTRFFFAS